MKSTQLKVLNNNLKQIPNIHADPQSKAQTKLGTQEITISKSTGFNECLLDHLKYQLGLTQNPNCYSPAILQMDLTMSNIYAFLSTTYPTQPSRVKFKSYLPASIAGYTCILCLNSAQFSSIYRYQSTCHIVKQLTTDLYSSYNKL